MHRGRAAEEVAAVWNRAPHDKQIARPHHWNDMTLVDRANGVWVQGWTKCGKWWNFGLVYGGEWLPENAAMVPEVTQFIQSQPYSDRLVMVGISALEPGATIPPHHDEPMEDRLKYWVGQIGIIGEGTLRVGSAEHVVRPGVEVWFRDADEHTVLPVTSLRAVLYIKYLDEGSM